MYRFITGLLFLILASNICAINVPRPNHVEAASGTNRWLQNS